MSVKKTVASLSEDMDVLSSQVNQLKPLLPLLELTLDENDESSPQAISSIALLTKLNENMVTNTTTLNDFRKDYNNHILSLIPGKSMLTTV